MNEEDRARRRREVEQGLKAARVLDAVRPLFEARESEYTETWKNVPIEDMDTRESLYFMVRGIRSVLRDIERDVETGEIAEKQLEAEYARAK